MPPSSAVSPFPASGSWHPPATQIAKAEKRLHWSSPEHWEPSLFTSRVQPLSPRAETSTDLRRKVEMRTAAILAPILVIKTNLKSEGLQARARRLAPTKM